MRVGSSRRDSGLFLVGQLALLLAALLWMPFGVRDSAGVSNVLPALRPAPADAPRPSTVAHGEAGEHRGPAPLRRIAVAATVVAAILLVARPRRGRRLPVLAVGVPRLLTGPPVGGRAPPVWT